MNFKVLELGSQNWIGLGQSCYDSFVQWEETKELKSDSFVTYVLGLGRLSLLSQINNVFSVIFDTLDPLLFSLSRKLFFFFAG